MSKYEPIEPKNDQEIVRLKVIKTPHWNRDFWRRDRIPSNLTVGSETWMVAEYIKHNAVEDVGDRLIGGSIHIEANRHEVNFDPECFEVICELSKEELASDIANLKVN